METTPPKHEYTLNEVYDNVSSTYYVTIGFGLVIMILVIIAIVGAYLTYGLANQIWNKVNGSNNATLLNGINSTLGTVNSTLNGLNSSMSQLQSGMSSLQQKLDSLMNCVCPCPPSSAPSTPSTTTCSRPTTMSATTPPACPCPSSVYVRNTPINNMMKCRRNNNNTTGNYNNNMTS